MIRETLLKASKLGHGARSIGRRGSESVERKRERNSSETDTAKRERNHASLIGERTNNRAIRKGLYRELYFQLYTYFIVPRIDFPR